VVSLLNFLSIKIPIYSTNKIHKTVCLLNPAEPILHVADGYFCERKMSEKEKPIADVEVLKARITELEAENEKLKTTMTDATKTLTAYVEKEREAAIKAIMEKTTLAKDELEKLDLAQLRLVQKGIDNVKGTVKNVRSAGATTGEDENRLTVGCLYHKEK
jgi:seryl-tRNA synthetase